MYHYKSMNTCRDIEYETLQQKCPTHFRHIGQPIGKGSYGTTYQACCGDDCSYAMKIIDDVDGNEHIDEEVRLQNYAAQEGYALPVYETQKCRDDHREAFVMDKLDRTLYQDLFEPSEDQLRQLRNFYTELAMRYMPQVRHFNPQKYIQLMDLYSMMPSWRIWNDFATFYRRLRRTCMNNINLEWEDQEPQTLKDTHEQRKAKLGWLMQALILLDGLNQINIKHMDSHTGNFMRRNDDTFYTMIDFGMAELQPFTMKNPDVTRLQESIQKKINHFFEYEEEGESVSYPLSLDVIYLIIALPELEEIASFEYRTDEDTREYTEEQLDVIANKYKYMGIKPRRKNRHNRSRTILHRRNQRQRSIHRKK